MRKRSDRSSLGHGAALRAIRCGSAGSQAVRFVPPRGISKKCFLSVTCALRRHDVVAVARDKGAQPERFGKMGVTPRAVHASIGE
jgi:hypothetical protein